MAQRSALAGFIFGLAVSAGLFILTIPSLFDDASGGHSWIVWVSFGVAVACGAGMVLICRNTT